MRSTIAVRTADYGKAMPLRLFKLNLANPVVVFALLWGAVLGLVGARLAIHLTPLSGKTVLLVVGNIVSLALIYLSLSFAFPRSFRSSSGLMTSQGITRIRPLILQLLVVWAVGSAIEVVAAGGLPFFWRLAGITDVDYRNFGLPTFHGFMNALYLFSLSALYLDYCVTGKRRSLWLSAGLLIWPVINVNRGLLVWALFQLSGIYMLLNRATLRTLGKTVLAVAVFVIVFGVLGDFRLGVRNYSESAGPDSFSSLMGRLPSGFAWTYAYVTSPLNNVNAAIDTLEPSYSIHYSIVNLFPTILRSKLYDESRPKYPLPLVVESYNTSTVYGNFLADFGPLGAFICVAVLQLAVVAFYFPARRRQVWAMLAYSTLFQALLLTVVADTFTSLVNVAQVVLALYVRRTLRRGVPRTGAPFSVSR